MADYIYLLQHRLNTMQRQALEAVREAARGLGAPVFLAGGAVRDLTSGAPVRDLDFAVQGNVSALVSSLEAAGATQAGEDATFSSRFFLFPGGVRVEVSPTLTVSYPKPGEPQTQTAAILDDLRRRDFTANAMAISLNEGSYGLLLDPLNGVADLENREFRLVSNLGFIEQPALLLRVARLSSRLGWTLEERTQRRYDNAREEGAIERLSAEARGYELEEVFHEEDPVTAIEHLEAEGWLNDLFPGLAGLKFDRDGLDKVRDTLGQMEQQVIATDPSPVYFPLLTSKLAPEQVSALKSSFARQGFVRQIESMEARTKELATQLNVKAAASPSATWKLLFAAEPEVVLALASGTRTSALQAKFKAFFGEWPTARQRIPYALMQEMRITPELPGYDRLLEDVFFALIDGKLTTTEETKAFLEPFSPPAPAQQAAPRRKAAKAARGRGRQPAAVAVVEEDLAAEDEDAVSDALRVEARDSDEDDDADEDDDSDTPVEPAKAAVKAEPEAGKSKTVSISQKARGKEKAADEPSGPQLVKPAEPPPTPVVISPARPGEEDETEHPGESLGIKSAKVGTKAVAKAAGKAGTGEAKAAKVQPAPAKLADSQEPSAPDPSAPELSVAKPSAAKPIAAKSPVEKPSAKAAVTPKAIVVVAPAPKSLQTQTGEIGKAGKVSSKAAAADAATGKSAKAASTSVKVAPGPVPVKAAAKTGKGDSSTAAVPAKKAAVAKAPVQVVAKAAVQAKKSANKAVPAKSSGR